MRKALMPLVASLALCGGVTGLLIATNAQAQQVVAGLLVTSAARPAPVHKPVMLALNSAGQFGDDDSAAPPAEGGDMMMDRGQRRGQFCKVMYAHKVGELAFVEARLSLTPAQTPLFARWKQVSLETAHRHEADCADRPARQAGHASHHPGPPEPGRDDAEERLSDLQAERPALEALYAALTPDQQRELGHGGGMHRPMMDGGMMRHGPMGRGPDGAPPPPPPQQ